jgi:hypothetical protein
MIHSRRLLCRWEDRIPFVCDEIRMRHAIDASGKLLIETGTLRLSLLSGAFARGTSSSWVASFGVRFGSDLGGRDHLR